MAAKTFTTTPPPVEPASRPRSCIVAAACCNLKRVNGASTDHVIESAVFVRAPAERLWREVTLVDIASFRHPASQRALGIPKQLRGMDARDRIRLASLRDFVERPPLGRPS